MSLNGIDISNWQAGIDLSKVKSSFVIMKATEGTTFVDKSCDTFYQKAKKLKKLRGVYHFATSADPVKQADFFVKNIKGYIGDAILVLDWESSALKLGPAGALKFLNRVYKKTGVKPLIYMSKSVCRQYDWSKVVKGDYGLWVAQYANNNTTGYKSNPWTDSSGYGAWKTPAIFQYTSSGRLSGYNGNLDLDKFYGDKTAWNKYAKSNKTASKTTTQKTTTKTTTTTKKADTSKTTSTQNTTKKTTTSIGKQNNSLLKKIAKKLGIL